MKMNYIQLEDHQPLKNLKAGNHLTWNKSKSEFIYNNYNQHHETNIQDYIILQCLLVLVCSSVTWII